MQDPTHRVGGPDEDVNNDVEPNIIRIDSPIRAGAVSISSEPERRAYPQGSTDNYLLMEAIHRLSPGAFKLWAPLVVRSAGKMKTWPSTETLAADTGESERSIKRWRAELVEKGFITVIRRGPHSLLYIINPIEPPGPKLVKPERGAKSGTSSDERGANSRDRGARSVDRGAGSGTQNTSSKDYRTKKRAQARGGKPEGGHPRAGAEDSESPPSAEERRHRTQELNDALA